jgi:GntR family transcriptional regulator, histidine utilization repressor
MGDVRGRIVSGRWQPGHRIPFEMELAATYACSRMTVNKALSELARVGLIERRRRAGSFVKAPATQSALLEIRDVRDEVEASGRTYGYRRLARREREATMQDRARLTLQGTSRVLAITCVHLADGAPYCFEERLINLAAVRAAAYHDFADAAPGAWLVAHVPWTAAEHRISAGVASRAALRQLTVSTTAPCLLIERNTWRAGVPITHVRFTYPGSKRQLLARFEPLEP